MVYYLNARGKAKVTSGQAMVTSPLIKGFGRQSHMGFVEFKATLGYTSSMQKKIQLVVAYTFIPCTREYYVPNPSTRGI